MPIIPPIPAAGEPALPLPAVPPLVGALLLRWLDPLLAWLTTLLTRALLTRCRQHPLVRLQAVFDLTPVSRACADFHHQHGPGAPPTYPVALLLKAELLRAWRGACSDRHLEHLLATDLLARWFVGLSFLAPSPDHATLARFHAFLIAHHHAHTLFAHVLATLDRLDPEDPAQTPQVLDTFALHTPAAPTSPAVVLLHLGGQLATTWLHHAPAALQQHLLPLDLGPLLHPPAACTAAQRAQRRHQAVTMALRLTAQLAPHLPALDLPLREHVQALLDLLAKVIADEYHVDPAGVVRPRAAADKGGYRLASPVDPEATFRVHDDQQAFGYNAALATTATRIRAAVVRTGATPDCDMVDPLLQQQHDAGLPLPPVVVMDQAGGHGKTRARVRSISAGQTTMVAWIPQAGGADQTRFTPADFVVDPERQTCRCPHDVVSTRAYRSGVGDGVHFRFTAEDCAGCPLWAQCRKPGTRASGHRSVFISDYHQHLRAAAALNVTAAGRALLAERWRVEPTIAWVVRYEGCRRARRVGQAAAAGQLLLGCAVRNLKGWLGRLARGQAPPPPGLAVGGVCP